MNKQKEELRNILATGFLKFNQDIPEGLSKEEVILYNKIGLRLINKVLEAANIDYKEDLHKLMKELKDGPKKD